MAGDYDLFRNVGGAARDGGWFYGGQPSTVGVKQNGHMIGCMCAYCSLELGVIKGLTQKPTPTSPSRLGWICSRCKRSLSPDVTACDCETCGE